MDFYNDTGNTQLRIIEQIRPMPDFVKQAAIIDRDSIPSRLFALPEKRAYTIADPASTYLSFGYWMLNNNKLSPSESDRSKTAIVKAAAFFDIGEDIKDFAKRYKIAESHFQKRAEEKNYGLPQEKSFPLHTPVHVRRAIDFFPGHYEKYTMPERVKIASHIMRRADDFNIPVRQTVIIKYANNTAGCDPVLMADNIASRSLFVNDMDHKKLFLKLARAAMHSANNVPTLMKLATVLEGLDGHFDLNGIGLQDPFSTVFNVDGKRAFDLDQSRAINIAGNNYPVTALKDIPPEVFADALGEDFVKASSDEAGNIDTGRMADIIETLPLPDKKTLDLYLRQYIA
jgi:hypothetical protein